MNWLVFVAIGAAAAPPATKPASQPAFQVAPIEFTRRVRAIEERQKTDFARYVELQWWRETEPKSAEWARWFGRRGRQWSANCSKLIAERTSMVRALVPPKVKSDFAHDFLEYQKALGQGGLVAVALVMESRKTYGKRIESWEIIPHDLKRSNDAYTKWMRLAYPDRVVQICQARQDRLAWARQRMTVTLAEDAAIRSEKEMAARMAEENAKAPRH